MVGYLMITNYYQEFVVFWYDGHYCMNVEFSVIVVEHICAVVFLRLMYLIFSLEIQTTLWLINIIAINIIMVQAQIFYDIYKNRTI